MLFNPVLGGSDSSQIYHGLRQLLLVEHTTGHRIFLLFCPQYKKNHISYVCLCRTCVTQLACEIKFAFVIFYVVKSQHYYHLLAIITSCC